jgi:hypothetical protein
MLMLLQVSQSLEPLGVCIVTSEYTDSTLANYISNNASKASDMASTDDISLYIEIFNVSVLQVLKEKNWSRYAGVIDMTYSVTIGLSLAEICSETGLPNFKFLPDMEPYNSMVFNVHPSYKSNADALLSVMEYFSWDTASVVTSPNLFGLTVSALVEEQITLVSKIFITELDTYNNV